MMRDKIATFFWSFLISFGISFGGTACLITAFDMQVSLAQTGFWCGAGALLCSLCFTLPLSLIPPGLGALACGYLWQTGSLEMSIESLLYRLSRQYHQAYGWGLVRWTMRTADVMELTLPMALFGLGILIAMVTAWTVCRRKPVVFSLAFAIVPLAACLVVTDTVPDTLWLYLLLVGCTVLLLSAAVRRQDLRQGNRLTALVVVPVALVFLILFAVSPQRSYTGQDNARALADAFLQLKPVQQLVGQFMDVNVTGTNVDGSGVDLTQVSVRIESRAEVMQVTADRSGTIYLRSRGLDTYDGRSWSNSGTDVSLLYWPSTGMSNAGEVKISTRYAHRMLYVPYYSRGTQVKTMSVGLENEKRLTQYSFPWSVTSQSLGNFHVNSAAWLVKDGYTYSQLFTHLSPDVRLWAEPLVRELTKGVEGDYRKAQIIGDYVRQCAVYDTNTYAMPGDEKDFARWFLEKSETGYCVHFATAATVLLQAAGIPARYVTGYTAKVIEGRPVVIEARQAHAWAEYWLAGYGWVVLEATPPAPVELPPQQTQPATQPSQAPDGPQQQATLPKDPEVDSTKPSQPESPREMPKGLKIAVAAAVCVAGLLLQYRLRLEIRKRRLKKAAANRKAIALWFTAVELARCLDQAPPETLYALAEKAMYSQHTVSGDELSQFDRYIRETRDILKKRSVFHQIWYRLIRALY